MSAVVINLLPLAVQILIPMNPEEEAALIDACSLASPDDPCVRVDVGGGEGARVESDGPAQAVSEELFTARVTGLGNQRFLVEVQGSEPRALYASVRLSFESEDEPKERARSLGLSVGTLATTLVSGETPSETPPELLPESTSPAAPTSESEVEAAVAPRESIWLVHATAGVESNPSWQRVGASFELGALWAPWAQFSFTLSGTFGVIPGGSSLPNLFHGGAKAGVGYIFSAGTTRFVPRLGFGIESLSVSLGDNQLASSAQSRVSGTSAIALSWLVPVVPHFYLQFEPSLEFLLSPTRVYVDDQDLGDIGFTRLAFRIGGAWAM